MTTLTADVVTVLTRCPAARVDDNRLWIEICKLRGIPPGADWETVVETGPNFWTVGRTARRVKASGRFADKKVD